MRDAAERVDRMNRSRVVGRIVRTAVRMFSPCVSSMSCASSSTVREGVAAPTRERLVQLFEKGLVRRLLL
jgi:hypothetical protein